VHPVGETGADLLSPRIILPGSRIAYTDRPTIKKFTMRILTPFATDPNGTVLSEKSASRKAR